MRILPLYLRGQQVKTDVSHELLIYQSFKESVLLLHQPLPLNFTCTKAAFVKTVAQGSSTSSSEEISCCHC